jgi:transcriptional regulator with XRE-family HTH domain
MGGVRSTACACGIELIYDLRIGAGLSQQALAEKMGTTQSVISRLEEGGGARNRIDTLVRVATALGRQRDP